MAQKWMPDTGYKRNAVVEQPTEVEPDEPREYPVEKHGDPAADADGDMGQPA